MSAVEGDDLPSCDWVIHPAPPAESLKAFVNRHQKVSDSTLLKSMLSERTINAETTTHKKENLAYVRVHQPSSWAPNPKPQCRSAQTQAQTSLQCQAWMLEEWKNQAEETWFFHQSFLPRQNKWGQKPGQSPSSYDFTNSLFLKAPSIENPSILSNNALWRENELLWSTENSK